MPKRRGSAEPVLITEARPSLDDEMRARRRKYTFMMATRVPCLVLAAVFYRTPVLLAIFVVGALALPWMAVLIANDRPPLKSSRFRRFGGHPDPGRALEAPHDRSRTIDGGQPGR